ncbi:hypothetical protein Cgig2_011152 [Carnegiea gigantea]|uniref:SWIM-type domain-containing protein n=1 Tax=Carnegiea gigantea TaxID=171969 RepID=A0A9Q1GMW7_9CARY|nr:hypothetical protein Cgig2_011152 [Carnegiea gigantea]
MEEMAGELVVMKTTLCSVSVLKLRKYFLHFRGVWVGKGGQRGYKVLVVGILMSNRCKCCSSWRWWQGREIERGDGKVTYEGGSRKCMVVKEGMGVEELMKMVREMTGTDILKYDREILVAVEGDSEVKVIFKSNDKHGYLYVAGNGGPVWRAQESAVVYEGRVRDCHDGKLLARTGRKCDDGVEVGREGSNNQAGVKRSYRSLGAEGGELPASRLRLGGDTIELSDDDKISSVSEDASDEETTKEDNAGDEQSAERCCDDGNKRKGSADRNYVNNNKLGKKMDKHKHQILKWKNGAGERIEQKLTDTYKKISCIAAVQCYSLMLGEYNVELTNNRKLVVKLGKQTCACRQWEIRGLPCYHALVVIAKANLWVYDYIHPIYKTATHEVIYN